MGTVGSSLKCLRPLFRRSGDPQSVVMDFIGHDSADVSHGYTHTGREALEKAAAAFPIL